MIYPAFRQRVVPHSLVRARVSVFVAFGTGGQKLVSNSVLFLTSRIAVPFAHVQHGMGGWAWTEYWVATVA
jgi:hypothetical protein